MCSIRTKGKREERTSLSSSMSRSLLFTPLLFTLCAVPLSRFGSVKQKRKILQWNPNIHKHCPFLSKKLLCICVYGCVCAMALSVKFRVRFLEFGSFFHYGFQGSNLSNQTWATNTFTHSAILLVLRAVLLSSLLYKILVPHFVCKNICFNKGYK